jgi:hypothetical protein
VPAAPAAMDRLPRLPGPGSARPLTTIRAEGDKERLRVRLKGPFSLPFCNDAKFRSLGERERRSLSVSCTAVSDCLSNPLAGRAFARQNSFCFICEVDGNGDNFSVPEIGDNMPRAALLSSSGLLGASSTTARAASIP